MPFLHRVKAVDRSCRLYLLHMRWYHLPGVGARPSSAIRGGGRPVSNAPEGPGGATACVGDGVRLMAARFFAAPVQAKQKEEPKDLQGPRLNEAITARFIRLVTDEGHGVVSREEALDRARRLNLDLVEVQRTAMPPVCKIMDYHKEKYKKETMEKERAKSKSESTIRKGDFKEVRLKGKIEQKDIEVKAEAVRGLIERGYRVKCMALPSKQRGTEECDLGALLSRLTDLIEDAITVESGPFVEKQQAYVVVRHVKFGSKKGTRKKANKAVDTTSGAERAASTTPLPPDSATIYQEAVEPIDIDGETEDEALFDPEDDVQDLPSDTTGTPPMYASGTSGSIRNVAGPSLTSELDSFGVAMSGITERSPESKTVNSFMKAKPGSERDHIDRLFPPKPSLSRSDFPTEDSNRYSKRMEMKSRPGRSIPAERRATVTEVKVTDEGSGFSSTNRFNRSPSMANSRWVEQQRSTQGNTLRQPPAYENRRREHSDLKQGQMPPNDSSPAPSYGIFSTPKHSSSDDQRMAAVNREKERNPLSSGKNTLNMPKSKVETTAQDNDKMKHGGWGMFSGQISNPSQAKSSGQR